MIAAGAKALTRRVSQRTAEVEGPVLSNFLVNSLLPFPPPENRTYVLL